ncbi:MAG: hypothetical protein KGH49_00365 [Candidatus Micrarchaeota archaeon]|nr:hypothetical protein [Candidatus Micrarchaeota archaeon]
MEISVEQLFNMLQSERKTGEVLPLPKDFYKEASQQLGSLEGSPDKQHSANFRKLLASVKERRIQKLLIYLAYNKQLPNQVPDEEEELYKNIRLLLESKASNVQQLRRVKISADMPELTMPNGSRVGPYKKSQVLEVADNYAADFLVNNKLAEQV